VAAGLVVGGVATPAAYAGSTSCGAALCMFQHSNADGLVLRGAFNVCGWYQNLKDVGFNDTMSSIKNHVNSVQSIYKDINYKGTKLSVAKGGWYPNLTNNGFNDVASSVVWIG
jgi:hypothetical protein